MRHIRTILRAAEPAGPGIRLLTLMDPDGWPLPRFRPGAHIDLHLPNGLVRAYSLCGDPAEADRWRVAVKREDAGRGGSAWLHDGLAVGGELSVSLPRCTFPLAAGARRHLFLAGGIGVTPFLSMAAALDRAGGDYLLHVLHRGAVPMPAQLAPLLARGQAVLHDTGAGRPDLAALLGPPETGVQAYACGPAGLLADFEAIWPVEQAQVEHFVPPPLAPAPDARPFTLVLARSGRSMDLPAGTPLLPALRALGAAVEASCEGGICGACRVRWLEGPPIHRDRVLKPAERATDCMACVAGCAGPRLVLDL
ncbi:oxidoreductase [Belnapia sp. T6]|uniref:Oxidoreductase n=1 Tax=Belnapia mucosa TaxID=2804532 RepID=A0ABS1V923_9PROT|nr:PDR/VanB family oxidoreductase [Belnapia mucosa]MBL6458159.1 oxidoreductase [Belnapia mucosa]